MKEKKSSSFHVDSFLIFKKMGKGIALTFCDIQFLSFGHIFANFHAYIEVWSNVMNILSRLPGSFQYFQFLWRGLNIKLQQFVTIFCWNIYDQTCRCLFCLFTFWEEKTCNRFLIHDSLFFLIHDRHREYICIIRTQLHWRYPVQSCA